MKKLHPRTLYLILSAASALFFTITFTTSAVYRFQSAGLNPLQLVLVGTMLEASVFLFEIPTGIVADLYSRRLSVIIGYVMIGAGFLVEGSFASFAGVLSAQFLWGVGYTFTSGALDAWLADELGEEKLAPVYLRGSQLSQLASFVGIFAGVTFASVGLYLPFMVGGGGMLLLALFLAAAMPESGFQRADSAERESWGKMAGMFKEGMGVIQGRPLLKTAMLITFIYGLYSEVLDRLWETHFLDSFTLPPLGELNVIYWFGLIEGATMLIIIGSTELVRRRVDKLGYRTAVKTLIFLDSLLVLGLIGFGVAGDFTTALIAYGTVAIVRGTSRPVYAAWLNRGIEPRVRATVLSTVSQMDAIGQVAGGPAVGALATRLGLRAAMILSGLIVSPVLGLYVRAMRQEGELAAIVPAAGAAGGDD